MKRSLQRAWLSALTAIVALLYAWVGLAAHGLDRALGLVGAVAITAALAVASRSRPAAMALLLLGALPLAIHSWFSIATPVLAVLCLFFGWPRHWAHQDVRTTITRPRGVRGSGPGT
jgi:hypothetical protein